MGDSPCSEQSDGEAQQPARAFLNLRGLGRA